MFQKGTTYYVLLIRLSTLGQAVNKGREELKETKRTLWYKLVQASDKKAVLFLRPYKGDLLKLGIYFAKGLRVSRDCNYIN